MHPTNGYPRHAAGQFSVLGMTMNWPAVLKPCIPAIIAPGCARSTRQQHRQGEQGERNAERLTHGYAVRYEPDITNAEVAVKFASVMTTDAAPADCWRNSIICEAAVIQHAGSVNPAHADAATKLTGGNSDAADANGKPDIVAVPALEPLAESVT